jgi:hypothetical protein
MDPLQRSPVKPWPDLEDDGMASWLPTREKLPTPPEPVSSSPPAWVATTSLTLVREVQKLVSAQGSSQPEDTWPPRRNDRQPVRTYSPFKGR